MAEGRSALRILTVTVSDSRKRAAGDEGGKRLDDQLRAAGFTIVRHVIVRDEPEFIQELVRAASNDNEADAVVLTGGTGITPRDQTFEALESLYDKRIDGFGEVFRQLSFAQMGPHAIFSRATAGIVNQCVVYSLPGSTRAVELGVRDLVIPTIEHAIELATGRATHTQHKQPEPYR
jgi:molybdenum cofactor biosynthesis protein B